MKTILTISLFLISGIIYSQTYNEIQKVVASDRAETARFGQAVAIDGTTAVSGSYGAGTFNSGKVYIFELTNGNWVETQILTNSDQENYDRFGWSVAIDGDYLIIGAIGEDDDLAGSNSMSKAGAAYIYENQGGTWVEVQKIIASDRSTDDEFGWSVDVDGNTIIVGAHQDFDDENNLNPVHHAGSVYIFDRDGAGVWNQSQKIVASDRALDLYYPNGHVGEDLSDQFGHSIGISGEYLIVGALNHDYRPDLSSSWQCGSAYVFERNGGVWTQVQQIINSDNAGGIWERFGSDVAIDSNYIAVGLWSQDYTAAGTDYMKNAGAVYIFIRDAAGLWNENQKLVAGSRNSGDHFGWDVKLNGDFLISGTEHDDHDENETNSLHEAGSAYIFERDGAGNYAQTQKIDGSDRDSLDVFGYAVDIKNNNAIVGAFQHDFNAVHADSIDEAGAVYIFSSCLPYSTTNAYTICSGQSITEGSSTYTTTGLFSDTYQTTMGCDSVIMSNLTVNPTYNLNENIAICDGATYSIGGSNYTTAGNYTDILSTQLGCDSIVNTNLVINPTHNVSENVAICNGDSYLIGGSTYTTAGNYTDVLSTQAGCDSVVNTNLSITPTHNVSENVTICVGDTYTIGSSSYSTNGTYTDVLTSTNNCDSTVNTTLSVISQIDESITASGNTISANQNNATSYQWIDCDNNNQHVTIATSNDQTLTVDHIGNYACIITVGSCSDTTDCAFVNYVGLDNNLFNNVKIYPNPTNGNFVLQLSEIEQNYSVKIMDLTGKIVYVNNSIVNTKTLINLTDVSNGIYFIEINTTVGKMTKKILIQK